MFEFTEIVPIKSGPHLAIAIQNEGQNQFVEIKETCNGYVEGAVWIAPEQLDQVILVLTAARDHFRFHSRA